jgi:hypothetical protein
VKFLFPRPQIVVSSDEMNTETLAAPRKDKYDGQRGPKLVGRNHQPSLALEIGNNAAKAAITPQCT